MTARKPRAKHGIYAIAAVIGFALTAAPATAVHADPVVTFDEPDSASVEYGAYWAFTARSADTTSNVDVTIEGAPASYEPGIYSYYTGGPEWASVTSVYPGVSRPLTPGSYTVKVDVEDTFTPGIGSATAALTISRASLGIDLRVLADSSNPTAAIVTARFTGQFVDQYQSSTFEGAALSPGGEWHIVLKDQDDEIAVERNFERVAGDDLLATSFYWAGAKPDTEYSATAEFVPTGASATNFDIASATTFTYTALDDPRPVPSSSATAKPTEDLPEASGFGLPLWALILGIVLIVGLGALVSILSIRLNKRPAAPSTGAATL